MPLACIVDGVSHDSLVGRLNDQRRDGEFCDVHLKICGRTLPTHACILSASSPYFRRLICSGEHTTPLYTPPYLTNSPREIDVTLPWTGAGAIGEEVDYIQVVLDLIDYIYTGKIELRDESVEMVVKLAETFMLDGLSSLIKAYVNESNKKLENSFVEGTDRLVPEPRPRRLRPPSAVSLKTTGDSEEVVPESIAGSGKRQLRTRKRVAPNVASSEEEKVLEEDDDDDVPATKRGSDKKNWFRMCRPNGFAFKCKQCDFVSGDPPAVRQHKLLHPGNSYVCVSCGYVSRFADKLLSHLREADHAEETRCSLCGVEAGGPEAFAEHLKRHDHPKIFFCEHCEQRFSSRWCLKTHSRKHATTRPHVCSTCGRGFKVKGALQAHAKTHGPPSSVKGFLCGHCGFRTAYKHNLLMHERIHSGDMVECPHPGCGHRSNSEYSIQAHMLIHSKERPYQCEICGANFSHPSNLRQHAKLHDLAANTIHCDRCDFTTLRVDKLRSHARKVHGEGEPIS